MWLSIASTTSIINKLAFYQYFLLGKARACDTVWKQITNIRLKKRCMCNASHNRAGAVLYEQLCSCKGEASEPYLAII